MARSGITPAAAAGGSSVTVTDTPYDYPEDSGHVTGAPGAFVLAVRNDAGTSLVDTTLDYAPLQVNAAGELRVTTAGGTPTGRDDTDNQAPVATGLTTNVNRMYVWDGTAWDRWDRSVTGTVELGATTLAALESITVQNGAGAAAVNIQDGGNSITVDGTVAATQSGAWTVAATQSGAWTVTADTELPAAILLADNMANPTVPQVGAHTMVFDGVTWDRWTGAVSATQSGLWTVALDAASLAALESITVQNAGGASAVNIQDGGNSITVDGTVTADTNFDYAEDSAHVSGNPGAFVLAVRNDALNSMVDLTGDYAPLQVNSIGELRVTTSGGAATGRDDTDDQAAVATGLPVNVNRLYLWDGTNWDRAKSAGSTGVLAVGGAAAHDAPSAGNPVLMGGHAVDSTTTITSVTAGDAARMLTDLKGRVYTVQQRPSLLGIYHTDCGTYTVGAVADAATVGRFWLINTSSTLLVSLRRVILTYASTAATSFLSAPRFTFERVTFTGTPSGAQITPAKRDSNDAANTGTLRTASTGLTLTAGAAIAGFQIHEVLTAVGAVNPSPQDVAYPEDERIVLRQNQGVVFRQNTAGSAADTRTVQVDLVWEEYTP